jgi:hypothetical protein
VTLQETFSQVMKSLLEEIDKQIAEERDTKRYRLLDTTLTSFLGKSQLIILEELINLKYNISCTTVY